MNLNYAHKKKPPQINEMALYFK